MSKIKKIFFNGAVKLIKPDIHLDNRGTFFESYNFRIYKDKYGIKDEFVQDNFSFSKNKNTIRGLHFQINPYQQSKLITVINGSILDVFVDLRKNSKTFGKYYSVKISDKDHVNLYISKGFAHGFRTLENNTKVIYKVSNYYSPKFERTIIYSDKLIKINWGLQKTKIIISQKDKFGLSLQEIKKIL